MDTLLSFKILSVFAGRMIKAIFPSVILLLAVSWWNRKQFSRNSAFWFLVVATSLTFCMRFLYFMVGASRYSNRYLYTLVTMLIVFAVPGFFKLIDVVSRKTKWRPRSVMTGFIIVFCLGSIGKGVHNRDNKLFVREMGQTVKNICGDQPRVLISDASDPQRLAYYAGSMAGFEFKPEWSTGRLDKFIKSKLSSGRVFVFAYLTDKHTDSLFKKNHSKLPLRLVKTFQDRKEREFGLYEYSF